MAVSAGMRLVIPQFIEDQREHRRQIGRWIIEANQGHLGNTGTVTLTASATSTTATDARAGPLSFIGLTPITADAASAVAVGNVYVSTQTNESFTITHPSSASTTKTFRFCILG